MEVERTCSILRETENALRLASVIASCQEHSSMVTADDLRTVLSPSDTQAFLTQWRSFFETEHEYNVACRDKDPNSESHQNIPVLGDKLKYLFRNLFRFVRKHPAILDKFATDPRLVNTHSPSVEKAKALNAYVQHVLDRLKAVGESSEVPNIRKRVAALHTVRQELKTRDEDLRKTSREETEAHAAQIHSATVLMQRVADEIRKASAEAATQRDAVCQVSDEELVRLNEDHAANMTTLNEEINRLKEEQAQELQRHQQDEEAARKKYKVVDKQIEVKVKAYDEEMARLTEKIALVTELHNQEAARLAEMQARVSTLVAERVQYEETVEKPRLQQLDLERRQALAVKLIQDTYRKFMKSVVIANPPASAAPKKGAKGKPAAPAKK